MADSPLVFGGAGLPSQPSSGSEESDGDGSAEYTLFDGDGSVGGDSEDQDFARSKGPATMGCCEGEEEEEEEETPTNLCDLAGGSGGDFESGSAVDVSTSGPGADVVLDVVRAEGIGLDLEAECLTVGPVLVALPTGAALFDPRDELEAAVEAAVEADLDGRESGLGILASASLLSPEALMIDAFEVPSARTYAATVVGSVSGAAVIVPIEVTVSGVAVEQGPAGALFSHNPWPNSVDTFESVAGEGSGWTGIGIVDPWGNQALPPDAQAAPAASPSVDGVPRYVYPAEEMRLTLRCAPGSTPRVEARCEQNVGSGSDVITGAVERLDGEGSVFAISVYAPFDYGPFDLTILVDGSDVPGSPFEVSVESLQPSPLRPCVEDISGVSRSADPGGHAVADARVALRLRSGAGRPVPVGGEDVFCILCLGDSALCGTQVVISDRLPMPNDDPTVVATVKCDDHGDGTYGAVIGPVTADDDLSPRERLAVTFALDDLPDELRDHVDIIELSSVAAHAGRRVLYATVAVPHLPLLPPDGL